MFESILYLERKRRAHIDGARRGEDQALLTARQEEDKALFASLAQEMLKETEKQ